MAWHEFILTLVNIRFEVAGKVLGVGCGGI